MNRRVAARLDWSLWALSLVLTALSLWLLVLNSSHSDVPVYSFWAENVLFSVGFSTVGAVIVPRMPPENPIGWLFCAVGFLWAMIHFVGEYAIYTLVVAPGSLPAGKVASWLYCWPWVLGLGLLVFLGLLFPNGRLPSARWRWFARSAALRDETDLDSLGEGLVRVVGETMQPTHVGLWLRPEGGQGEGRRQDQGSLIERTLTGSGMRGEKS